VGGKGAPPQADNSFSIFGGSVLILGCVVVDRCKVGRGRRVSVGVWGEGRVG